MKVLKDCQLDDSVNADKMVLFYKCLPNKILIFKDDDCHGGKNSWDRITVLVGTNMSGKEILWLLVIVKRKNPRILKKCNVFRVSNINSWMTDEIFEKWILKLDRKNVWSK